MNQVKKNKLENIHLLIYTHILGKTKQLERKSSAEGKAVK